MGGRQRSVGTGPSGAHAGPDAADGTAFERPEASVESGHGAGREGEDAAVGATSGNGQRPRTGGADEVTVRRTRRWRGVVAVVLVAIAVGLLTKRPSVLLLAVAGVAYSTYPWLAEPSEPQVSVERSVEPGSPDHDEVVSVTTTVRNTGDRTLLDLRLVDGVPPMLSVVDGSPRRATALRPGGETVIEYALCAKRGTHRFQPVTVLARDASGAVEVETSVPHETAIECSAPVLDVPLRARSRHRTGRLVTDDGGGGIEFHRTREYRRGDPSNRIDWRRLARSGELSSIEFREERLAEVVLCVDARPAAYRASGSDEPHAVAYAVAAVESIAHALFEADHRVGLTAVGRARPWLSPGSGRAHEDDFFRLLAAHPAFSVAPPDGIASNRGPETPEVLDRQLASITARLGGNAQVVLLSPLCDDGAVRIAERVEASGRPATVVSVDVTADRTHGGRLARIERENRINALRGAGIPVVDWDPDEPLGAALAASEERRP